MKTSRMFLTLLFAGLAGSLAAADAFKLECMLYVFRDDNFAQVSLGTGALAPVGQSQPFAPPARLSFDHHFLELTGPRPRWDGAGESAPSEFSKVETPVLFLQASQEASLYCAMPVEYMEKAPDGSLQVRRVDRDAPNAPHYQVMFELMPDGEPGRLAIDCQLQLLVMAGREKIPGVELDVGRPILSRFAEDLRLLAHDGEWSGVLLRKPGAGDYSMLLLLKAGVAAAAGAGTTTARPVPDAGAPEPLDEFVTRYYRNPRPQFISELIEAMASGHLLDPNPTVPPAGHPAPAPLPDFWVMAGFFAEVFAANPDRVDEWQRIGRKEWMTRDCLRAAAKFSRPGALLGVKGPYIKNPAAILSLGNSWGSANRARWGGFYATGNPAYLRKFVDQLRDLVPLDSDWWVRDSFVSLSYHAPAHPLVRTTLEAARLEADPRTRAFIDDLLTKDLQGIQQEMAGLTSSRAFPDLHPIQGLRSFYFGPVNPAGELHPKP